MATVYRVQNKDGHGPYRCIGDSPIGYGSEFYERCQDVYLCPGPVIDFGFGFYASDYVFGFPKIEALHVWFGWDMLSYLFTCGFSIVEIETDEVIVSRSRRQCVIPKKDVATEIPF